MGLRTAIIASISLQVSAVLADSWTVTQAVNINADTILSQTNVGNGSVQSNNMIKLSAGDNIMNASQSMPSNGKNMHLSQNATNASHQTINRMTAEQVNNAIQNVYGVNTASLTQDGFSNNNIQALNLVVASEVNDLNQSVVADLIIFNGNGSGNIQAGNYIKADFTKATQNFSAGKVLYSQSGTNNIQAGNVALTNNSVTQGNVSQNFMVGNVTAKYSEIDEKGSIKAANYYAE